MFRVSFRGGRRSGLRGCAGLANSGFASQAQIDQVLQIDKAGDSKLERGQGCRGGKLFFWLISWPKSQVGNHASYVCLVFSWLVYTCLVVQATEGKTYLLTQCDLLFIGACQVFCVICCSHA